MVYVRQTIVRGARLVRVLGRESDTYAGANRMSYMNNCRNGEDRGAKVGNDESKPGHTRKRRSLLYIIPGNPGESCFYIDFGREIVDHVRKLSDGGELCEVHSLGHINHTDTKSIFQTEHGTTQVPSTISIIGLREQVHHHATYLKDIISSKSSKVSGSLQEQNEEMTSPDYDRIIIVGHSIGAWIAMEAWKSIKTNEQELCVPSTSVAHLIMLMPFLETDFRQSQQKFIATIASSWFCRGITGFLVFLIRWILPTFWLRERVASIFLSSAMTSSSVAFVARTILENPYFVLNALYMAKEEFEDLAKPSWRDFIHSFNSGQLSIDALSCLYCPNDPWAPFSLMEQVKTKCNSYDNNRGPFDISYNDAVSHGFCTNASQTAIVAEWIANKLVQS